MNIITLDYETYYDDEYTLSKMTTESYVRDPRFEVHGVGIRWSDGRTQWYEGDTVFRQFEFKDCAVLCHHAQFDGLILSHHYGIKPKMFLDTLSMARLLIGAHLSVSLESLLKHFGMAPKTVPYDLFRGKHWHELSPAVQQQVAEGCCDDVQRTWDLFQKLAASFPRGEYAFVDSTVRMFTNPVLVGDTDRLGEIWQKEENDKRALLDELQVTAADLRKQWKFAELLRAEGIEPEQKPGKPKTCDACGGTGGPVESICLVCKGEGTIGRYNYAFAKTDDFMRDLLDSEDERVAMLAQAKLDAHATGTQTRTARLGWMSTRGPMCVYLNYAGTHLGGWSGGDKVNWQNFKRGGPIAGAIRAPKGHLVVMADASQIECRLLNEIAGQKDVVERFRRHEDPYVALASFFYGRPITKADEAERGTGKQGELSCGYGAGAATIKATAKKGAYGPPVLLSDEDALRLRDAYRSTHPYVVRLWDQAGDVLKKMHADLSFTWNVVEIRDRIMWLPNGVPLRYDTLEWHEADDGDSYFRLRTRRNGWTKIYGAKFVENLIQALRNVFIRQAWQECMDAGLDIVTQEHDKLVTVVREHEADAAFAFMRQAMSRAPSWLPSIPLDSEGYISETLARPDK
jgi:hypothetical protein